MSQHVNRRVVISGCSGGGKSTLLEVLAERGFATMAEPGRRVVRDEMAQGGTALPWVDMAAFAIRALALAQADHAAAAVAPDWVFFDRGIVDAAVALAASADAAVLAPLVAARPYHPVMFLAPPWPEIYVRDAERPKDFATAVAEHERLARAYPTLGYRVVTLPRASPEQRADFVLATLAARR
ncbi:MAG: ATPase [Sphingomonas sp.]|nr:ATPase [Sphingomonas sp.]